MKLWKKITLALVTVVLLAQVPLIYRRRQLASLRHDIALLNSQRVPSPDPQFVDYKGVVHVHSNLGGHSTGTLPEIVRAAEQNGLDFVVMTEHPSTELDSASLTLTGMHRGVLFLGGNENASASGDRVLSFGPVPGGIQEGSTSTDAALGTPKANNNLTFVAYPSEFKRWDSRGFDGIEVYNLYTNSKEVKPFWMALDGVWSLSGYGDLLFVRFFERPDDGLALFDRMVRDQNRRLTALAGVDAHQNVGFGFADSTGKRPFFLQLDPYERSFAVVRNHVLIARDQPLNATNLAEAFKSGHTYISFDILADPTGFMFSVDGDGRRWIMGDELPYTNGMKLTIKTPVSTKMTVLKNGEQFGQQIEGSTAIVPVDGPGVYRVEVGLPQLGPLVNGKPWIISNPIYIR